MNLLRQNIQATPPSPTLISWLETHMTHSKEWKQPLSLSLLFWITIETEADMMRIVFVVRKNAFDFGNVIVS